MALKPGRAEVAMRDESSPTVLVVDDEEMVGSALASFLELETSYHVLTFTRPAEALDHLEAADCIIADFMMPEMDGIEFLKRARKQRPEAARIMLTGYADKENAIRAINEVGLYYYLEKPWNNEHLKLVVRNAVERSRLLLELESRAEELEGANAQLAEIQRRLIQAFL